MKCPNCNGKMKLLQEFSLADYPMLSMFLSEDLLEKASSLFIYHCTKCGKLEFFTEEQE